MTWRTLKRKWRSFFLHFFLDLISESGSKGSLSSARLLMQPLMTCIYALPEWCASGHVFSQVLSPPVSFSRFAFLHALLPSTSTRLKSFLSTLSTFSSSCPPSQGGYRCGDPLSHDRRTTSAFACARTLPLGEQRIAAAMPSRPYRCPISRTNAYFVSNPPGRKACRREQPPRISLQSSSTPIAPGDSSDDAGTREGATPSLSSTTPTTPGRIGGVGEAAGAGTSEGTTGEGPLASSLSGDVTPPPLKPPPPPPAGVVLLQKPAASGTDFVSKPHRWAGPLGVLFVYLDYVRWLWTATDRDKLDREQAGEQVVEKVKVRERGCEVGIPDRSGAYVRAGRVLSL